MSHTWHIARLYEKKRENFFLTNQTKQDTHSRYLVPFVKPCWYYDSAAQERGCTASRLKDWGNIFVTECKSNSEGEKMDKLWRHRFILLECKQKRSKLIKYIFVKLKCKYPHLQELECWSYLLSRHGIFLYVIYMQFIILWLSLFCICVC